jgi:hypothetical protein
LYVGNNLRFFIKDEKVRHGGVEPKYRYLFVEVVNSMLDDTFCNYEEVLPMIMSIQRAGKPRGTDTKTQQRD